MPKCALPEHLDTAKEWAGTDDDQVWWMRWRLHVKGWFAFANRCPPGITGSIVFFPGFYVLPFSIWFTGWSWWYFFPLIVIPVARQWRLWPYCIFAIRGKGTWRIEGIRKNDGETTTDQKVIWLMPFFKSVPPPGEIEAPIYYLSRNQYWCRWHVQLQWPLFLCFHFYFQEGDIIPPLERGLTDGKLINCYRGWHCDDDEIFWGDGGFLGTTFK